MLLTVAVIGPARALKGEVRLDIRTDDPEGRLAPGAVLPTAPADAGPLTVTRLRFDGSRWFAVFAEAGDRTAAEALRGVRLLVETDDEDAEDDAWYAHELIGLRAVRRLPDGSAETLGEVVDLERGVAILLDNEHFFETAFAAGSIIPTMETSGNFFPQHFKTGRAYSIAGDNYHLDILAH